MKLRYMKPGATESLEIGIPIDWTESPAPPNARLRFAAAVAAFADALRGRTGTDGMHHAANADLARGAFEQDIDGRRAEFVTLVTRATELATPAAPRAAVVD